MEHSNQNQDIILKLTCIFSSLLKRWKLFVLWVLLFGIVLDVYKTLTYQPQYISSITATLSSESNTYAQLEEVRSYIKTLDYIFNGQVVKNYVQEQLKVKNINMSCSVVSQNNTNIVNIQVLSDKRQTAYYALDAIVSWYQKNIKKYRFSYELDVLEEATINEMPVNNNNHLHNFIKGATISGIIFIAVFCLFDYFKRTIKTPKDIEKNVDCRLLAKIPKEHKPHQKKFWKHNKQAILISSLKTSFKYKESIKKLRNRIEASCQKHGYQSIMLTSSLENEGKSSIAANLALALAANDHKVLIIDCDLRKPSLHKIFHLNTQRNINEYLNGKGTWEKQVQYLNKNDLFVLCAIQDIENAENLLSGERIKQLINNAKKEFDFVIIDTSPIVGINDALIVAEIVDASLLVIKQNEATDYLINDMINRLVSMKNNLIGCIYNASVIDLRKTNKVYGYHYGYNQYRRHEKR